MIMRKIQYLFIALFICLEIQAQDKFNICLLYTSDAADEL